MHRSARRQPRRPVARHGPIRRHLHPARFRFRQAVGMADLQFRQREAGGRCFGWLRLALAQHLEAGQIMRIPPGANADDDPAGGSQALLHCGGRQSQSGRNRQNFRAGAEGDGLSDRCGDANAGEGTGAAAESDPVQFRGRPPGGGHRSIHQFQDVLVVRPLHLACMLAQGFVPAERRGTEPARSFYAEHPGHGAHSIAQALRRGCQPAANRAPRLGCRIGAGA